MADGQLNTSLKEVNDLISNIDQNVSRLSGNWKKFLSEKPNLAALQAVLGQYEELAKLDKQLTKNAGGSKSGDTSLKNFGNNIDTNTQRIRNQLAKLGTDATVMRSSVGVSFAGMASEITKAMQNIGQAITVTPTGNDKLNTIAQNLAERFRSETEKAMKEKAVDASKIIKTGIVQSGVAEAAGTRLSIMRTDAARLGLQPTEFDPNVINNYQQAYAELIATQQKAIDKKIEFDAIYNKGTAQTQGIEAVVSQYSKWEAELERIEKEQTELNIKQEAGLISAQEAAIKQQSLIEQQKKAKEGLARIDKTTEQADRELRAKEASDLREMASLYESIRKKRKTLAETNWDAKGRDMTKEESMLIKQTRDALQGEIDKLEQLKREYAGNAQAEQLMHDQEVKNIQHRIEMKEREAKVNAPKVSLGSTTGDVTTVSGAYRTQIKLYEEENRLLREQEALKREIRKRVETDEDTAHLAEIDKRLKQIQKDRDLISNTPLFKSTSDQAKLDYTAKQTAETRKRINEATMASAGWAIENAKVAQTYQQLKFASDNIRNILQNTELTKEEARNLSRELKNIENKIRQNERAMGIFKEQSSGLLDVVSQLAQGFGVMFSLQSVSQFARKIVEIRGEFELQEVALKAIVQDSLKGQQIWNETIQNALKSPFSVKQLVTYTKQLAAYRIETDKLTDTTKRLADISAGLGVDMQRLILAYGQVKAANYLRASEVRQFTEAGVNMYGELSKYFTEIEGRAISTADVVERVSKRMVSFEDVAEVFKRLTDEGGTFYNMQEIQSETVRGQVMKLRDAYDIMLNKIGESHQGTIKWIVDAMLGITKNYEKLLPLVKSLIDAFLIFKVILPFLNRHSLALSKMLATTIQTKAGTDALNASLKTQGLTVKNVDIDFKRFRTTLILVNKQGIVGSQTFGAFRTILLLLRNSARLAGIAFKTLGNAIKTALMSNPFGAILLAITTAISLISNAISKARRLNKLIADANNKLIEEQTEAVATFKRLADEAVKSDSIEKQTEALQKLKNAYGDMVPAYMLEVEYLANLKGNYDSLTESINGYLAEKAYQQALEDNKQAYQEDINTDSQNLIRALTGMTVQKSNGEESEVTKGIASYMQRQLQEWLDSDDMKNKIISDTMMYQKMAEIFKSATGDVREINAIISDMDNSWLTGVFTEQTGKNLRELAETHNSLVNDAEEIKKDLSENGGWIEVDWMGNLSDSLGEINTESTVYIAKLKQINQLLASQKRLEELEKKGNKRNSTEDAEYRQLRQQLKKLSSYQQELNQARTEFTNKEAEDVSNFLEVTNEATQQKIAQYNNSLNALQEQIEFFQRGVETGLADGEGSRKLTQDELKEWGAILIQYQKKYEEVSQQSIQLMNNWTTGWNQNLADGLSKLNINEANQTVQNYIKDVTAIYGKTPKEVGKATRTAEKSIKEQIEDYKRILKESGEQMAFAITGVSADMVKDLEKLQKYLKGKADELIGPEKEKNSHKHDPYSERLSVLKEIYQEAKKINKELYSADKSAQRVLFGDSQKGIDGYKKAFESAFGKIDGKGKSKMASEIWSVVQESLVGDGGWGSIGGGINEAMIKGLEKYKEKLKDPKHIADMEKLISQLKVELEIDDSTKAREKFVKGIDDMMSDVNIARELKKLRIPVDMYSIFNLKATSIDDVEDELNRWKQERIDAQEWGTGNQKIYEDKMRKIEEQRDKERVDRMKKYMKYMTGELSAMEKLYYEEQVALREIEETFRYSGDNEEEKNRMRNAADAAVKGVKDEYKKKMNQQAWKDFTGTNMYSVLFGDLDKIADETLDELRRQLNGLKSSMGDLSPTELHQIEVQLRKIDEIQKKRRPLKGMWDDFMMLTKGGRKAAIKEQAEALKNLADANSELTEAMKKRAALGSRSEYNSAEWDALTTDVNNAQKSVDKYQKEVDDATDKVNAFARAQNNLAEKTEKLGNDIKSITSDVTSAFSNYMKMTGRMGDVNDQVVQSINQMANDFGDAIGNIAKIIASEGSDITAWIGLVASIGAIISDGIDIDEASIQKEIDNLTKKINTLSRRVELFQRQMDKAMQMDDYFRNYNSALDSLSEKYNAIQEQYNAEQRKKNPDSEALESYRVQMEEVKDEMDALREKMRQEWGGIGESNFRSSAEEFVDAWMQAFQETGDGLSGLQDNFDEFVKNLFKKQATMRIASKMLEPLFLEIDKMVGEDGTVMSGQLDAVREKAAQIFPELNEALKALWEELGIGTDATDTLSGLQQGIQGITEATAEVIEGYLNSIRFFIAEDNMMLRQIRDAVQSGAGNAMYMELHAQTILLQKIWDKFDDITTANQTAHTMAVRIVA